MGSAAAGGGGGGGSSHHKWMPVSHRIYFRLAAGSVLMSAGRYQEALRQYGLEGGVGLPPGHLDLALLHSARAFALNALGRLRLAFEELVMAMVSSGGQE